MKKSAALIVLCMLAISVLVGCGSNEDLQADDKTEELTNSNTAAEESIKNDENADTTEETETENMLKLYINDEEIPVTWEENKSVKVLENLAGESPVVIDMSMYGGFEQVGSIGQSLTRNDKQMTTSAGDIVLYSGNQLVVFYGSNSWAYTKLGHIDGKTKEELSDILGKGDVTITLKVE